MIREFFLECVPIMATIILLPLGLIIGLAVWVSSSACEAKGREMRIDTSWGLHSGCMITLKGQKLPWEEVIPVERNGAIVFEPRPRVRIDGDTQ